MNPLKNLTNVIAKARELDGKSLEAIRFAIFGLIVADIFGLWYLLGWKKLAAALLIFLIIALVIILILERNLPRESIKKIKKEEKPKMDEETTEETSNEEQPEEYKDLTPKEPEKQGKSTGMFGNMDLGLGNADEFQKRAEKALGTMDNFGV